MDVHKSMGVSMRRTWTKLLLALCAAGLLPGCHVHRDAASRASTESTAGIELREPHPGLYTAGQPAASDWAEIAARGIGTVIDLRAAGELKDRDEAAEVAAAGMRYVAIPVAGASAIDEGNANALRTTLQAATGPVLVHCASGNRAGGLLALMEARSGPMTVEQALEFGRNAGMTSTEGRVRQLLEAGK